VLDIGSANLSFKFKADNFDGSVPLREFLTQFDLIAQINCLVQFGENSRVDFKFKGKKRVWFLAKFLK